MKPEWLKEREAARGRHMCINCTYVGKPCGQTNRIGNGQGRANMYQCAKHPSVKLHFRSLACEDYTYGPTGAR